MRAIVSAPDLRRASHGLVESANHPQTSGRWEQGVAFTPRGCNVLFGHAAACPAGLWSGFQDCALVQATPWIIEAALVWSTADLAANPKGLLTDAMDVGTSAVLERLTSSGVSAVAAPTAINPPAVTATLTTGGIKGRTAGGTPPPTLVGTALMDAGPYSPAAAVGAVEAKLLDAADHIGQAGTLMLSPKIAAQVNEALVEHGDKLYTRGTGSLVIVGNFEPGTVWGVAGDVDVYLSEIAVTEVFEHRSNEVVLRAERYAVAVWGCAAYGATVT